MDLFKLVATLGMDTSEYEQKMASSRNSFSKFGGELGAKAVAVGQLAARAIEKAATAFVDLGKSAVTAAAEVKAEEAQFKATFGTLEGMATKAFDAISDSTGVMSTRLRGVGTKAFSQFTGAGMDAAEALKQMEAYTTLAADAAAYYDMSVEDADQRLRSFLRGNTEAGDAIGLFTSEAQRNTAAVEKYGKKWKDLTEEQKQMVMLDVAGKIYEQSGVIGQASREADSWTNVIGDFKETWRQTLALFGEPIVVALTPIVEKLTGLLGNETVKTTIEQLGLVVADMINMGATGLESFFTYVGDNSEPLKTGFTTVADSLKKVADLVVGNVIDFLELLIGGPDGMDDTIENIGAFYTDVGTFIDNYATEISTLISLLLFFFGITNPAVFLIAAMVAIVANWKDIKEWAQKSFNVTKNFFGKVYTDNITPVLEKVYRWWGNIWGMITKACDKLTEFFNLKIDKDFEGGVDYDPVYNDIDGGWGNYAKGWGGGYTTTPDPDPPLATGMQYVPFNNMRARLHEGEAVLTKTQANDWRSGQRQETYVSEELLEEIRALRQEMERRREVFTPDGRVIGDIVTETVSRNIARSAQNRRFAATW